MTDIKYVTSEDWQGIYINGWLAIEGHEIQTYQAMHIVAKSCKGKNVKIEEIHVDKHWLEDVGNLPNKLDDIPSEYIIQM